MNKPMNNVNKKIKYAIIRWALDLFLLACCVAVDQITKYYAVLNLKDKKPFVIWDGVFELNYLENTGAAFGMLKNQKALFVLIVILVLLVISYILIKTPATKKFNVLHVSLILIAAGAIGNNLIDRLRFDYVIDFFYIRLINFPIFNVADLFVCIGTAILAIVVLFVYKEEDFEFMNLRKKSIRQIKE